MTAREAELVRSLTSLNDQGGARRRPWIEARSRARTSKKVENSKVLIMSDAHNKNPRISTFSVSSLLRFGKKGTEYQSFLDIALLTQFFDMIIYN